jgi:hypothetical protein
MVTGPLVGALFANPEVRTPTTNSPAAPPAPMKRRLVIFIARA